MKMDSPDLRMTRIQRRRRRDKWADAGQEPALADAMNDPIVHLVMRRDRLTPDDVWPVLERARKALQARTGQLCAAAGAGIRSEAGAGIRSEEDPQAALSKLPLCWQCQFSRRQLERIVMPTASRQGNEHLAPTASDACFAIQRKLAALNGYLRVGRVSRIRADTWIVEIIDRSGDRVVDIEVDGRTGRTIRCT